MIPTLVDLWCGDGDDGRLPACLQGQENDVLLGAQTDIPVDFFAVVAQSDNESKSVYYKKLWVGKLR